MALPPLLPGTGLSPDGAGAYRYRVDCEIGSGGFGVTYDAEHLGLGRRVVIKELACDSVSRRDTDSRRVFPLTNREGIHQRVQKRFVEEARLLSRLAGEHCPHIVRVIDVFEENGTAYYVMDRIETSGHVPSEPLPGADGVRRALRLGRELLVALDVAHRYTRLHGDIKPANLLLDNRDRLVLIDFGTARSDEDIARTRATTMHTPGYAPPELMSAPQLREAGAWSDLYSWAMVVYGLLWRHPWQIEDDSGGMIAWPLDAFTRLRAANDPYGDVAYQQMCSRGVPAELSKLICSCLSLTPAERPQQVSTFLMAYDAAMQAPSGVSVAGAPMTAGVNASVAVASVSRRSLKVAHPATQVEGHAGGGFVSPRSMAAEDATVEGASPTRRVGHDRQRAKVLAAIMSFLLLGLVGLGLWDASRNEGDAEVQDAPQAETDSGSLPAWPEFERPPQTVAETPDGGTTNPSTNPAVDENTLLTTCANELVELSERREWLTSQTVPTARIGEDRECGSECCDELNRWVSRCRSIRADLANEGLPTGVVQLNIQLGRAARRCAEVFAPSGGADPDSNAERPPK